MRKIALTGNIASGKSTVKNILIKKGYKVLDTDDIAHKLLDKKSEIIISTFANYDITENGKISRQKLAKIVFNNTNLRQKLENIIHPLIKIKIEDFFKANLDESIVFVEIPLVFEAGMQDLFDEILFIACDDEIRLKRLILRNNITKQEAENRINSQISQQEKISKSNFVIYNNSTVQDLENELNELF